MLQQELILYSTRVEGEVRRRFCEYAICDGELVSAIHRVVESRRAVSTRKECGKSILYFCRDTGVRTFEDLKRVTTTDVIRYRNALQGRGLAPATINNRLGSVRNLFRRLIGEGTLTRNPVDTELVPPLQVSTESSTEYLNVPEVQMILDTCDGTLGGLRDRALLLTLYYQGLRRSEVTRLDHEHLTRKPGLMEIVNAKSSPYAKIRIHGAVKESIDRFHGELGAVMARLVPAWNDPVFPTLCWGRIGQRLAPSSVNYLVKLRARRAGITRRITTHSWRHTCATVALMGGAPIQHVQRHLRHRSIESTLRYDRDREVRSNPTLDCIAEVT